MHPILRVRAPRALSSTTLLTGVALIALISSSPSIAQSHQQHKSVATSSSRDSHVMQLASLNSQGAQVALDAAVAEARSRQTTGAIAVVDVTGNLVAFERLDGTFPGASDVAIAKARTAALFRKATNDFEKSINSGRTALLGAVNMVPLQGGLPILHGDQIVGAVGVSGASSQVEDEELARAGVIACSPN